MSDAYVSVDKLTEEEKELVKEAKKDLKKEKKEDFASVEEL